MSIRIPHRIWRAGSLVGLALVTLVWASGLAQETAKPAQVSTEDARGQETFLRVCVKCHPAERVTAEGRSRSQWENTIDRDADVARRGGHAAKSSTSSWTT